MEDKQNFETSINAEYRDEVIRDVVSVLEERLQGYTRYKTIIIKVIDRE